MGREVTQIRLILTGIFLFSVIIITGYLQSIFHFNTYLALAICLADTIVASIILFGPHD